MWINNIIVGFIDDFLVAAARKGGIRMRMGHAMVGFLDRHFFGTDADWEDTEAEQGLDADGKECGLVS